MSTQIEFRRMSGSVRRLMAAGFFMFMVTACVTTSANAQYFQLRTESAKASVVEAKKLDSVLFVQMTPFGLPQTSDSIQLTYHEPMPDSIMPRSAIVVGQVTVQAEDPTVLVEKLEKFARKAGADWIVSFAEPRVFHNKAGDRLFRGTATLLRVLDPTFIQQTDLQYSYFEDNKLPNYASVASWFDTYGRHMGSKMDAPSDH